MICYRDAQGNPRECNYCNGRGGDYCMCELPESKLPPGGFWDNRCYQFDPTIGRYIEVESVEELSARWLW